MNENAGTPAAPAAVAEKKGMPGLAIGRDVHARDPLGTVRAAIITDVVDAIEGEVNLVEFGRFMGEEAAVLSLGYRYAADGVGNRRWWWPPKV